MKNLASNVDMNSPDRFYEIQSILRKKPALKAFYVEAYRKYAHCIEKSSAAGAALEIGSGGGFAKEIIPHIITSDIIAYPNVDKVMDAARLDYAENSLSCICMFNVLHHIPNTPVFFHEAIRCLAPGGRIFMIEPYAGWISSFIFKHFHHEGFDTQTQNWEFTSNGPLSDANNALPSIIFERDIKKFKKEFPELTVLQFKPHSPLRYWLTGGLQNWSLMPTWAYDLSVKLDNSLMKISSRMGSFVDIELVKA